MKSPTLRTLRRVKCNITESLLSSEDVSPLSCFWIARMLLIPGIWKNGWCKHEQRFDHEHLLTTLGLKASIESKKRNPPVALATLVNNSHLPTLLQKDITYQHLHRLSRKLGLPEAAARILTLTYHLQTSPTLYKAGELLPSCSQSSLNQLLATLIGLPEVQVQEVLQTDSTLRVSQMFYFNISHLRSGDLTIILQLDDKLISVLNDPDISEQSLVSLFYQLAAPAQLELNDFCHIQDEVFFLLRNAVEAALPGINLLFYGPAGTGKTQLARLLANTLGYPLAAIPELNRDGTPLPTLLRLGQAATRSTDDTEYP